MFCEYGADYFTLTFIETMSIHDNVSVTVHYKSADIASVYTNERIKIYYWKTIGQLSVISILLLYMSWQKE